MPNAGRATPELKKLYDELRKLPGAQGSGIVASKSGYHSSRAYNQAYHPYNYSIQLTLDQDGPRDAAAAVDISCTAKYQKLYTARMIAAMDARDPRVGSVKEIYGSVNGKAVVGRGKKSRTGKAYSSSSDSSHLWHIHMSIFRSDVDDWNRIKGIIEVFTGENLPDTVKPEQPTVKPAVNKPEGKAAPRPHYEFPLPRDYFFGHKSGPSESVSGYYGRKFHSVSDTTWLKRFADQLGKRGWSVGKGKQYLGRYGNDGKFGDEYVRLVKAFQSDMGLAVDGFIGPKTWEAAFERPTG